MQYNPDTDKARTIEEVAYAMPTAKELAEAVADAKAETETFNRRIAERYEALHESGRDGRRQANEHALLQIPDLDRKPVTLEDLQALRGQARHILPSAERMALICSIEDLIDQLIGL